MFCLNKFRYIQARDLLEPEALLAGAALLVYGESKLTLTQASAGLPRSLCLHHGSDNDQDDANPKNRGQAQTDHYPTGGGSMFIRAGFRQAIHAKGIDAAQLVATY